MSDKLKLLTFVGLNDYKKVEYAYKGTTFKTELFAEALFRWHAPTRIIAFLTPKAKESGNWNKLQERIPGIAGVDIPDGNSVNRTKSFLTSLMGFAQFPCWLCLRLHFYARRRM